MVLINVFLICQKLLAEFCATEIHKRPKLVPREWSAYNGNQYLVIIENLVTIFLNQYPAAEYYLVPSAIWQNNIEGPFLITVFFKITSGYCVSITTSILLKNTGIGNCATKILVAQFCCFLYI